MGHTDCSCPQKKMVPSDFVVITVNPELQAEPYTLPRIEDIFAPCWWAEILKD